MIVDFAVGFDGASGALLKWVPVSRRAARVHKQNGVDKTKAGDDNPYPRSRSDKLLTRGICPYLRSQPSTFGDP